MKIIAFGIVFYLAITQTAYGVEKCGSARHTIPPVLRYIFPLLFRKMKYASLIDMVTMIWWHVWVYSWIINVIIHKNLNSYHDDFLAVLIISMIVYTPISLKEYSRYEKWKKKNESFVGNLGDVTLISDEDLELIKEYRNKYVISNKRGVRVFYSAFAVMFTLLCIGCSFSEDYVFALLLWSVDALFIMGYCNISRWRITVKGEKISYRPSIGRTRNYEIKEIEYCKIGNGIIEMYGKNKRLFFLDPTKPNAGLLLQDLKERNILIYK